MRLYFLRVLERFSHQSKNAEELDDTITLQLTPGMHCSAPKTVQGSCVLESDGQRGQQNYCF